VPGDDYSQYGFNPISLFRLRYQKAWQDVGDRVGYGFSLPALLYEDHSSMTNRVMLPPQDFQKMCKQAERDQESRKLVLLLERVKRQIAERENRSEGLASPKRPATRDDTSWPLLPIRLFER
jgi:hypothetical protein